LALIIILIRS